MNEIIAAIGNVGFPIVISIILVLKVDKSIAELTDAITRLEGLLKSIDRRD